MSEELKACNVKECPYYREDIQDQTNCPKFNIVSLCKLYKAWNARPREEELEKELKNAIWWIKQNAKHPEDCAVWDSNEYVEGCDCNCNRRKIIKEVEDRFGIIRGYEKGE